MNEENMDSFESSFSLKEAMRLLDEEELYEEQLRRDSECDWDEVDKLLNKMEITLKEKCGGNNDVR